MPTFPAARIQILDVELMIVFIDQACPPSAGERAELYRALAAQCGPTELADNLVAVWQDAMGRTRFIAPPQQHPFFQTVSYLQLRAQVNGALSVPDGSAAPPPRAPDSAI